MVWGLVSLSALTKGSVWNANTLQMDTQTTVPCAQAEDSGLLGPLQSPNWVKVCLVATVRFLPVSLEREVEKCLGLCMSDMVLCLGSTYDSLSGWETEIHRACSWDVKRPRKKLPPPPPPPPGWVIDEAARGCASHLARLPVAQMAKTPFRAIKFSGRPFRKLAKAFSYTEVMLCVCISVRGGLVRR